MSAVKGWRCSPAGPEQHGRAGEHTGGCHRPHEPSSEVAEPTALTLRHPGGHGQSGERPGTLRHSSKHLHRHLHKHLYNFRAVTHAAYHTTSNFCPQSFCPGEGAIHSSCSYLRGTKAGMLHNGCGVLTSPVHQSVSAPVLMTCEQMSSTYKATVERACALASGCGSAEHHGREAAG